MNFIIKTKNIAKERSENYDSKEKRPKSYRL